MIGQLRGILLEKQPPLLMLEVHGIGYEVDAPMSTFYHLPEVGQELTLHIHFVVREDAQHLYGFYTLEERTLFRALLKVNGVGPRLALTILSSMTPGEFVQCVTSNNVTSLVRLPGVGKKTAERLIIEMRDRLSTWAGAEASALTGVAEVSARNHIVQDAISALIALGYKPQEASKVVAKVEEGNPSSEAIIRSALRELAL